MEPFYVRLLVGLVFFIHFMVQAILQREVNIEMLSRTGVVTACFAFSMMLFNKWLWRLPVLYPIFVRHPNLEGNWRFDVEIWFHNPKEVRREFSGWAVISQEFNRIRLEIVYDNMEGTSRTNGFAMIAVDRKAELAHLKKSRLAFTIDYEYDGKDENEGPTKAIKDVGIVLFWSRELQSPDKFEMLYVTEDSQHGKFQFYKRSGRQKSISRFLNYYRRSGES